MKLHDLTGGEFTMHENPILTKSGDERLIGWRNTVLHDDEGNITGVLSSGSDITESREVETALRKTTDRFARPREIGRGARGPRSVEGGTKVVRSERGSLGLWELRHVTTAS